MKVQCTSHFFLTTLFYTQLTTLFYTQLTTLFYTELTTLFYTQLTTLFYTQLALRNVVMLCLELVCIRLMFFGMSRWVNVMLCLMYVSSPPNFTTLSVHMGVLFWMCWWVWLLVMMSDCVCKSYVSNVVDVLNNNIWTI